VLREGQPRSAAPARGRRNYPYAGKGDGLTSYLRTRFGPADYVGVELEVNQRIVTAGAPGFPELRRVLIETLRCAAAACAGRDARGARRAARTTAAEHAGAHVRAAPTGES
jgi:hypothetical protein